MKKILYILILVSNVLFSQTLQDAYDFGVTDNYIGSARFNALSGAVGALGQDLSSININPASASVFRSTVLGISVNNVFNNFENTLYSKTTNINSNNIFNINQLGIIISNYNEKKKFKSFSFGVNTQLLKDMNQRYSINNAHTDNSIAESFVRDAQYYFGSLGDGSPDEIEGLAKSSEIIDYDDKFSNYTTRRKDFENTKTVDILNNGNIREFAFSFSTNYNDILYLGASYLYHSVDTYKETNIREIFINNISLSDSIYDYITYQQKVSTSGMGSGFSLGAIWKPTYYVRFGVSYKSAITYYLKDLYTYELQKNPSDNYEYNYMLEIPSTLTFSGAFVFRQLGFISFDYETKDYSSMMFSNEYRDDFDEINEEINLYMRNVTNIRVGAEFRWLIFRFRGGFGYNMSPFDNGQRVLYSYTDNATKRYSLGLGIVVNRYDIDFSFVKMNTNYSTYIYNRDIISPMNTTGNMSYFTLTLNYYLFP